MHAPPNTAPLWERLTHVQRQYVVARQTHPTKSAAAEAVGLDRRTPYAWPPDVEEAVAAMQADTAELAMAELRRAALKAALHKIAELDSPEPYIAARAATELLDRGLGKATQRVESTVDARWHVSPERIEELTARLLERAAQFAEEDADEWPEDEEDGGPGV